MDDHTALLLNMRAMLHGACELMDRVIAEDMAGFSTDERTMIGAGVFLSKNLRPRSRADCLRWIDALTVGDEAWLVLHARRSGRVEATHHGTTPWKALP